MILKLLITLALITIFFVGVAWKVLAEDFQYYPLPRMLQK